MGILYLHMFDNTIKEVTKSSKCQPLSDQTSRYFCDIVFTIVGVDHTTMHTIVS